MHGLRLRVTGRVQGVGYRYSACQEARRLGLAGWARNCPDGSVELWAQGESEALSTFAAWCGRGPAFARVHDVESSETDADPALRGEFAVRT